MPELATQKARGRSLVDRLQCLAGVPRRPGCAAVVVYDAGSEDPTIATIEALAQLQLHARRLGFEMRLTNASTTLRDLISLFGLEEALPSQSIQSRLPRRCLVAMTGNPLGITPREPAKAST